MHGEKKARSLGTRDWDARRYDTNGAQNLLPLLLTRRKIGLGQYWRISWRGRCWVLRFVVQVTKEAERVDCGDGLLLLLLWWGSGAGRGARVVSSSGQRSSRSHLASAVASRREHRCRGKRHWRSGSTAGSLVCQATEIISGNGVLRVINRGLVAVLVGELARITATRLHTSTTTTTWSTSILSSLLCGSSLSLRDVSICECKL